MSVLRLSAIDYLDPVTEAHYAFFQASQEITTVPHCHDFYELFLVVNGRINHHVNGTKQLVKNGDLTFIRPEDVHYFCQDIDSQCQLINLSFSQQTILDLINYLGDGFAHQHLLGQELPPSVLLTPTEKNQVQSQLEHLNNIHLHQKNLIRTTMRVILLEILTRYFPSKKRSQSEDMPQWLEEICQVMQEPQNFAIGVSKLYDLAAVTPEHISRSFKKHLDVTPTQYINDLRLNYAAKLLLHSNKTILDISLEAGFESLSHFYHLFNQKFEQSPAHFRKSSQKSLIPF